MIPARPARPVPKSSMVAGSCTGAISLTVTIISLKSPSGALRWYRKSGHKIKSG